MKRLKFQGKTEAYRQFTSFLWRTQSLIDLGVVGIDKELEEKINPIVAKLSEVKGARGRTPKNHKPKVETTHRDGDSLTLSFDQRSAFLVKQAVEHHKKIHEQLRYFHYANLAVALWAAFETYNATLFEQLYRERPELLKSSEQLSVKDAIENREALLDFLIERQLESIGHLKLRDIVDYYKKRLGIELTEARIKQLETFYFLRNVVAHKTGRVRPLQRLKASADFYIVGDEIRVSRSFLMRMSKLVESSVRSIERQVIAKFYKQAPNPSIERTRPGKPGRASHVKR